MPEFLNIELMNWEDFLDLVIRTVLNLRGSVSGQVSLLQSDSPKGLSFYLYPDQSDYLFHGLSPG